MTTVINPDEAKIISLLKKLDEKNSNVKNENKIEYITSREIAQKLNLTMNQVYHHLNSIPKENRKYWITKKGKDYFGDSKEKVVEFLNEYNKKNTENITAKEIALKLNINQRKLYLVLKQLPQELKEKIRLNKKRKFITTQNNKEEKLKRIETILKTAYEKGEKIRFKEFADEIEMSDVVIKKYLKEKDFGFNVEEIFQYKNPKGFLDERRKKVLEKKISNLKKTIQEIKEQGKKYTVKELGKFLNMPTITVYRLLYRIPLEEYEGVIIFKKTEDSRKENLEKIKNVINEANKKNEEITIQDIAQKTKITTEKIYLLINFLPKTLVKKINITDSKKTKGLRKENVDKIKNVIDTMKENEKNITISKISKKAKLSWNTTKKIIEENKELLK